MGTFRALPILCIVGLLTNCYSIQARYSFDSETDFSGLKTYAWLPGVEAAFKNPSNAGHYQKSMDEKLASEGFMIKSSHPVFLIYTSRVETYKERYLTKRIGSRSSASRARRRSSIG